MGQYVKQVEEIAYHRNGVSGAPFYVIRFTQRDENDGRKTRRMLAVVFDEPSHVAVFDRDLLGKDDIEFGHNSWRGDHFEPELREFIKQRQASYG